MKIGVLGNCQSQGLGASFQALLPDAEVRSFLLWEARTSDGKLAETAAFLRECDYVFSQPLGENMGVLANARLRPAVKHFRTLPGLAFGGFHPDQIYIWDGPHSVDGPTGQYQSRLAVIGFLAGLTAEDTAALYRRLAFARLGYLRSYTEDFAILADVLAMHGLEAEAFLAELRASGCFMYSGNHPKPAVLLALARLACRSVGLEVGDADPAGIKDFLYRQPTHPVFDDVAAAIGVAPEGMFRGPCAPGQALAPISTVNFVSQCFEIFARTERGLLRRADGVAAGLAALGLRETAPCVVARRWRRGMALMTWHGTLLRVLPDGNLAHTALHVPDAELRLLRADWQGDAYPESLPLKGGVAVRDGGRDGTVALAEGGRLLGADRDSARIFALRDAAGDWESFLPVSDAQLDVLRNLLSGEWAKAGAGGAAARLVAGPAVLLGAGRIDLLESWPVVLPDGAAGAARLAVLLDGAPAVLRQTARPAAAAVAQKITVGGRLALTGAAVMLPLPLTLNDADRIWLHDACGEAEGLPWQAARPEVTVCREADQRVLGSPPLPGDALNEAAALDGPAAQISASGAAGEGWAAPLLRLLAMAPYLDPETKVLAPGGTADGAALAQAWAALGLPAIEVVTPPAGFYLARDIVWLDNPAPGAWPAETLRAVRDAFLGAAAFGEARLFLRGKAASAIANLAELERALAAQGFTVLDLQRDGPAVHLAQLRGAGWILGVGEDLLHAAFCPAQCKIVELTSQAAFRPDAWLFSCRLGLSHAVLPCGLDESGFGVDVERLGALVRMLKFRV